MHLNRYKVTVCAVFKTLILSLVISEKILDTALQNRATGNKEETIQLLIVSLLYIDSWQPSTQGLSHESSINIAIKNR